MISLDYLVHVGALIFLIVYLVRDQILIRALIVIGTIFYITYSNIIQDHATRRNTLLYDML